MIIATLRNPFSLAGRGGVDGDRHRLVEANQSPHRTVNDLTYPESLHRHGASRWVAGCRALITYICRSDSVDPQCGSVCPRRIYSGVREHLCVIIVRTLNRRRGPRMGRAAQVLDRTRMAFEDEGFGQNASERVWVRIPCYY